MLLYAFTERTEKITLISKKQTIKMVKKVIFH